MSYTLQQSKVLVGIYNKDNLNNLHKITLKFMRILLLEMKIWIITQQLTNYFSSTLHQ